MILCVGEILADMFGSTVNGVFSYERNAGGAPFNVACAIKKFGGSSVFVGNVGDDAIGKFLVDFAVGRGLDECYVTLDEKRNTTLAFVELDESGERSFCFYRKNTADYHLPEIPEKIWSKAKMVVVGSLMLSENEGFAYAEKLIERAKQAGKEIAFDVNFRSDVFSCKDEAIERYKSIIEKADVLKLSSEETEIFGEAYLRSLKDKLICVSLGKAGSVCLFGEEKYAVPSVKVTPVDTTGAGDAFFAGFLTKLPAVKSERTAKSITDALLFGNVCGALTTRAKGAIDGLPSAEEAEEVFAFAARKTE